LLTRLETKWVLRGGDKVGWPEGIGLFKKLLECADLLIENEDGWIAAGATPSQPPPLRGGGANTPSPLVGRVGEGKVFARRPRHSEFSNSRLPASAPRRSLTSWTVRV
jgi:hypothetical protein